MIKGKNLSHLKVTKKDKYYLGLDLGISSVGWAVMVKDQMGDHYLHDFGVRIFYLAEDRQKVSDVQKRREFRSQRRLIRRRAYRIKKIKKILGSFLTEKQFKKDFNWKSTNKIIKKNGSFITEKGYWNPFVARNKGLEEKLTKAEIYAILIHFCKKRGYLDKFSIGEEYVEWDKNNPNHQEKYQKWLKNNVGKTFDEFKRSKETKFSSAIDKAEKLIKKYGYVSGVVLNEPEFQIKESKQILIYVKNGKYGKNKNDSINYKYLFSRKAYEDELKTILEKQSNYYEEIKRTKDELIKTVFQQRDFEVGPKCKEHKDNIKNNKKCNSSTCSGYNTFIESVGTCPFYPKEKRGYKSSLSFSAYYFVVEISKFLSFLRNKEKIKLKNHNLLELLKNFITRGWQKKEIKNYLIKNGVPKPYFSIGAWKEMVLDEAVFLKEVMKIDKLKKMIADINFHSDLDTQLSENKLNKLGNILNQNITPHRCRTAIKIFLQKNHIDLNHKDLKILTDVPKKARTTSSVSSKHMATTIKLFLKNEEISKDNHTTLEENMIKKWKKSKKGQVIFDSIKDWDIQKNPIVFRAVNQARKVLKKLYEIYGNFEAVNIEMARDIANRKKDLKEQKNNAKENKEALAKLKTLGIKISKKNLIAYKLWSEQKIDNKNICLYCGETISQKDISLRHKVVEIDHIIPISKFADNSYQNKVLVHSSCNQNKGNRTPLQFLVGDQKAEFRLRVAKLKPPKKRKKGKNYISIKKYNYLMVEKIEGNEDFEKFISRNLNDTGWITKWFLGYVKNQLRVFDRDVNALAINGKITSQLRKSWLEDSAWGLQKKVRDITPFHHAVDAMILCQFKGQYEVEFTNDLYHLNELKQKTDRTDYKEFAKNIKNKWQERKRTDFVRWVQRLDNEDLLIKPRYIKDLKQQIEKRIPVILSIEKCMVKTNHLQCEKCSGAKNLPKFEKLLNQEEWEEKIKDTIPNANKVNLRFQLVSYMTNYKTKGSWASSENFGFGVLKKGEVKSQKALKEKIKKWNEYSKTLKNKNKSFVFDKKTGKIKPDCDGSSADPGFVFDKKTGNVTLTNQYYGLLLENNKNKWIRQINIKKFLKNKNTLESIKNKLLVKGVNIRYLDQKKDKYLVKVFRAKNGAKTEIHPNQLQYISGKILEGDKKILKSKKIFNGWINNEDTTNNIQKEDFKIIKIDILGNIVNN